MKVGIENFLGNSHSRMFLERGESEILAAEGIGLPYNLAFTIRLWISSLRTQRSGDPSTSGSLSDYCFLLMFQSGKTL